MTKAMKNGATFETYNNRDGKCYVAKHEELELWVEAANDEYLATLCNYGRVLLCVEGNSAKWALHQLMVAAKGTSWTDDQFFATEVFPLAKNLNEWMKRPERETYNMR